MDVSKYEIIEVRTNGSIDAWAYGRIDAWTYEYIDFHTNGSKDAWTYE